MRVARRDLFQKKHDANTPARATASEMRTMTVAAACGAWCMDISDLRLESSCARAGWNLAQDGSENMRAGVVLPSSRAQIYPSNDQFSTPTAPSQAGFGVSVIGKGPEVDVCETAEHQMPQLEPSTEWKWLVVLHEESDSRKDFLSKRTTHLRSGLCASLRLY